MFSGSVSISKLNLLMLGNVCNKYVVKKFNLLIVNILNLNNATKECHLTGPDIGKVIMYISSQSIVSDC